MHLLVKYVRMEEQTKLATGLSRVYETIARLALYLMVGLVPLTFLPWTVEALEVNKQTLVLLLVSISVIAWLGMMVTRKKFYFKKSGVFVIALLLLIAVAISSNFSLAPFVSWVGQGKQEYTSFLTFLSFTLLFITGSHFLSDTAVQRKVWVISLLASSVVGVLAVLDQVGVTVLSTNLIGSPNSLGLYLTIMAVLGSGLWLVSSDRMKDPVLPLGFWGLVARLAIFTTSVSALLVLLALDYWALWAALMVGLIFVFTFTVLRAEEFPNTRRFFMPMILFVCGLIFLFMPSPALNRYAVEVSPSYDASFNIAISTLKEGKWLFGSGPGTFVIDYTKYHPVEVNQTVLWDQKFDRAINHMLTTLATLGIVGTTLFLLFIIYIAAAALKMLIKEKAHDEWKMTFVAFSAWSVVVFSMFVYSSNFTLSFMFWLLSAVIISQVGSPIKQVTFSKSPRMGLLVAFLFVLITVGLLVSMLVSVSRYASEISFAKAVATDRAGGSLDEVIKDLDTAARLNKLSDIYYRNLGNALLLKTGEILQDPAVDPNLVRAYIGASINASKRTTELSPSYVVNWALLGDVYREIAPLVRGADDQSIIAYQRAVELSPNNPKYYVALGRAYMAKADSLNALAASEDKDFSAQKSLERDQALLEAIVVLEQAIELKPDYAPAHFQLANAHERQGNLSEAIAGVSLLSQAYPLDIGISLQLGLLYLRQGKQALAQTELERTIAIAPNYSNAHWFLSAVYEQNGEFDKAIKEVELIKELNPDNAVVEQRLKRLKEGRAVASSPQPLEEGTGNITDVE